MQTERAESSRNWPLHLGLLILAALWLGPLPAMSRTAFSLHMILHLGVVALAAPLLAIGLARAGLRLDRYARASWLSAAFIAELVVVWGWHLPAAHEAAALHTPLFVAQQANFLAAGLAIWLLGFARQTQQGQVLTLCGFFLTFAHMTMLGLVLIMAPRLIYPPELCLGAFGLQALDDQRLGGMLMAGWSALVYLGATLALAVRLLGDDERPGIEAGPPR